jgi:hypothetical protein
MCVPANRVNAVCGRPVAEMIALPTSMSYPPLAQSHIEMFIGIAVKWEKVIKPALKQILSENP